MDDPGADPVAELLARVAAQDRAAFRSLYDDCGAKLLGVLLRILGSRAEDTQVWLRAGRYDASRGRGMTWLVAVARNLAIDRLRARGEEEARPATEAGDDPLDRVADSTPRAETRLVALGEARRVVDCLATLERDRAAAVKGAYLDGLSYADLASRHGVPLNTMRTWLRRSLLKLKECLGS